jgi:hypothetical protein
MNFTPTMKGSFLAGIGFWTLLWCAICKIDSPMKAIGLGRWLNKTRILNWIRNNRSDALLATEVINYGSHGASADGVVFALGGTLVNVLVIYVIVPLIHNAPITKSKRLLR